LQHQLLGKVATWVNYDSLAGELADVALYLLQIASIAGIDLEQAILKKLEYNDQGTWDQDRENKG